MPCALRRYAIKGGEQEWDSALGGGKLQGNVSIKSADGGSSKKRKVCLLYTSPSPRDRG